MSATEGDKTFLEAIVETFFDRILYLDFEVISFYAPVEDMHKGGDGRFHIKVQTPPEFGGGLVCLPLDVLFHGVHDGCVRSLTKEEFLHESPVPILTKIPR